MNEQQYQAEVMDELKQSLERMYDNGFNDAIDIVYKMIGELKDAKRNKS
jgi:hypothetical protein